MKAIRWLTMILLMGTGFVNLTGGILAVFPGLFEVAADPATQGSTSPHEPELERAGNRREVTLRELARTRYGATALLLMTTAFFQLGVAANLRWLLRWGAPFTLIPLAVAGLGVGTELWGWHFKGELSGLNLLGIWASGLLGALAMARLRGHST